jgi:K+-sensing histidine kinase KdpD
MMLNSEVVNDNLVVVEPDAIGNFGGSWTFLYARNAVQAGDSTHEKEAATYDRLLRITLDAICNEMHEPLALISQAIEMLEDPGLGLMTGEQLDALTALRRQAHKLEQMIDNLPYIAAFVDK